jgi:coiled-coil domain-containing protein 63/114
MGDSMVVDPRETELFALQKEYRVMEHNRRQYAEESQALLRKQQSTIDKLRRDNEELKGEIALSQRSTSNKFSSSSQQALAKLHEDGDKYASSIEFERRQISTMEEQINIMKQKVLHQRKSMGGINASKDNFFMIQKQIRILENRLDKALVRFNESIAHNKSLRDNIDDLRRERVVFENIYRKMERELQERKQKMAEIIELSNQSYEQRDAFQMEIAAIEQANRKEHEEFDEQTKELTRMLEVELRLPTPSAQNRTATSTLTNGGRINSAPSMGGTAAIMDANNNATNSLTVLDNHSLERIQNFEEAFNKIKAATGITDIEELVRAFIKNEDHNFSLFNYVNEQNNEVEKLEEQLQLLRVEEKHYAQESGEDVVAHKQILKELEAKLATTENMAEKYEMRCQDLQRAIESLKRGIQSTYERLEINNTTQENGDDEDGAAAPTQPSETLITESNLVYYLGLIEQKANQILAKYSGVRSYLMNAAQQSSALTGSKSQTMGSTDNKSIVAILGSGPKIQMGQETIHIQPPKLDDYQSDDEDVDDDVEMRPMTRDELKTKTLNRLQRRGGNQQQASNNQGANSGANMGKQQKQSKK